MSFNTLFIGWNRAVPGKEKVSVTHFEEFISYLGEEASKGHIQNFEPVLLETHAGDLNGFVIIRGKTEQLHKLECSEKWMDHMTRGQVNMLNLGVAHAWSGDGIQQRMNVFKKHI